MEPAQNFSLVPPGTNPHCFEIITANVTYFVGETPGGAPGGPHGQGAESARGWETAIRQALMPVILQDAASAPGHTPHSKSYTQVPVGAGVGPWGRREPTASWQPAEHRESGLGSSLRDLIRSLRLLV